MTAAEAPVRRRPPRAGPRPRCRWAAAAAGTAPQPDALDVPAARRAVLVRPLPDRHGLSAAVGPAGHPSWSDTCSCRLRAVRGGGGRLDGVAGRPASHRRPGHGTPRPRWAAWLVTWAATAIWAVIVYLCVWQSSTGSPPRQAAWGHPPWWPVAVGGAELAAFSALGFAAGALFPSRFTAPLAAFGAFFLSLAGFHNAVGQSSVYALISPTTSVPAARRRRLLSLPA